MAGSQRDERAWVRGAQRGSVADLEALFRHHWPRAYRAAYLVVHDSAAAATGDEQNDTAEQCERSLHPEPFR